MIAKWLVVSWVALGTVLYIASVGKVRTPITPRSAAIATLINAVLVTAIVIWWQ